MDYVTDSFDALTNDESIIKKSLIGTLVMFASILILPYFIYQGYLLRILEETETGIPDQLPKWNNLGELFVNGIVAILIPLVITLPVYVIMYGPLLAGAQESVVLVSQLVGLLLSLVFSYLTLALLALYARDGLNGVTDFGRIKNILLSVEYLVANVALLLFGIIFGVFMVMLAIFTLGSGLILTPFIVPPINYLFMVIVGSAISEAEGTTVESSSDSNNSSGGGFSTGFEEEEVESTNDFSFDNLDDEDEK